MKISEDDVLRLMTRELDLDDGEIDGTSTMDQVENWDSLSQLRLCMAIEAQFGVSIPVERVSELTSVAAISSFLANA